MLELALLIICNGLILGFLLAGFIGELSLGSRLEKQKQSRRDNQT